MAKLVTDSGTGRRKHTAPARKAVVSRQMAAAIVAEADHAIAALPKYTPGDTPRSGICRAPRRRSRSRQRHRTGRGSWRIWRLVTALTR
jgi:hypothetical protein